jgi:hypothetical protein
VKPERGDAIKDYRVKQAGHASWDLRMCCGKGKALRLAVQCRRVLSDGLWPRQVADAVGLHGWISRCVGGSRGGTLRHRG